MIRDHVRRDLDDAPGLHCQRLINGNDLEATAGVGDGEAVLHEELQERHDGQIDVVADDDHAGATP